MANIAAMSDMMYLMFVFGIVFISLPPQPFKIFLCLVAVYVMRRMFVNTLCFYYSFREVFKFTFNYLIIKKIRYNQFFISYD